MRCNFAFVTSICLSLLCATSVGQQKGSVHGNVFREAAMGLTYEFPQQFSAKVEREIPSRSDRARTYDPGFVGYARAEQSAQNVISLRHKAAEQR